MTINSDPGHGSSPAAWITVVIMLVAITLGTLAFWVDIPWLVFGSVGLLILGAVVGLVLRKAGYGVGGSKLTEKVHS
jgi:hypothetical protein